MHELGTCTGRRVLPRGSRIGHVENRGFERRSGFQYASLIWYNLDKPFEPCLCEQGLQTKHSNPAQALFSSRMRILLPKKRPIKPRDQGGIVVGHEFNYKEWHYGDRGVDVSRISTD